MLLVTDFSFSGKAQDPDSLLLKVSHLRRTQGPNPSFVFMMARALGRSKHRSVEEAIAFLRPHAGRVPGSVGVSVFRRCIDVIHAF